jgi:hypothetical protein
VGGCWFRSSAFCSFSWKPCQNEAGQKDREFVVARTASSEHQIIVKRSWLQIRRKGETMKAFKRSSYCPLNFARKSQVTKPLSAYANSRDWYLINQTSDERQFLKPSIFCIYCIYTHHPTCLIQRKILYCQKRSSLLR